MIGNGWIMLMECLLVGWVILLFVLVIGVGKYCSFIIGVYVVI